MIGTELYRGQGFGNQLWVYATLRSLAIDQNLDFSIIGSHRFKGKDFIDLDFGLPTLRSTARIPRERTPGAFTSYLREELIYPTFLRIRMKFLIGSKFLVKPLMAV
jgi:hypothetical protein